MASWFGKWVPAAVRVYGRKKINELRRGFLAPRMVYGYQGADGIYRPLTRISDTVYFNHPERVFIEDNVFVGHYSILDGTGVLKIGEGAQLAAWIGVYTHSSHTAIRLYGKHYQEVPESEKAGYSIATVSIGRYAFVGAGSIILPGVTIGKGALVSAGSIVKRHVGDFEIVAGNPAEVVGDTRELDNKHLSNSQLKAWYNEWNDVSDG